MVRNYKNKSNRQSWSEENMKNAVAEVLNKKLSCRQASEKYIIPRETLRRRITKCLESKMTIDDVCKKGN